jgi:rhodanese-related sulfurtransferase
MTHHVFEVDVHTAHEWIKNGEAVMIDVREPVENEDLRIPGATLIPLSQFDVGQIPAHEGKKLLVHCASGGRSARATERCVLAGVEAYNVQGGIIAWHDAGYVTETGV